MGGRTKCRFTKREEMNRERRNQGLQGRKGGGGGGGKQTRGDKGDEAEEKSETQKSGGSDRMTNTTKRTHSDTPKQARDRDKAAAAS